MPALSPIRANMPKLPGLEFIGRGKVRDTYALGHNLLLVVATDALSIFDFVLNTAVPYKGAVLTAMNHFWLTRIEVDLGIKTQLVAAGADIDHYLEPRHQGNPDLQSCAMVVQGLTMSPVEFVARGYLTGSGLKDYRKNGQVCGIVLPPGLQDGDRIESPIDTPTTKADAGHDEPLDAAMIRAMYPRETDLLLKIYGYLHTVAQRQGFLLADTKLEFGCDRNGNVVVADEVGTPDSSRFWEETVWQHTQLQAVRQAPPAFDKQVARQWGITQGIDTRKPEMPDDVAYVHGLMVPSDLVATLSTTYRQALTRITGYSLDQYWSEVFRIA